MFEIHYLATAFSPCLYRVGGIALPPFQVQNEACPESVSSPTLGFLSKKMHSSRSKSVVVLTLTVAVLSAVALSSCSRTGDAAVQPAAQQAVTVGVTKVARQPLERQLTVSS